MANNENLLKGNPATEFSSGQEAVENGAKGGLASGIAKRKEKVFTKTITDILNRPATNKMLKMIQKTFEVTKDVKLTLKEAMVYAQTIKAINNKDTKAFNALVDRVDGKAVQETELKGNLHTTGITKIIRDDIKRSEDD